MKLGCRSITRIVILSGICLLYVFIPENSLCSDSGKQSNNAVSTDIYLSAFNYWNVSYERALYDKMSIDIASGYSPSANWKTDVKTFGLRLGTRFYPEAKYLEGGFAGFSIQAYDLEAMPYDSGIYQSKDHLLLIGLELMLGYKFIFPNDFQTVAFFVEPVVGYMTSIYSDRYYSLSDDDFKSEDFFGVGSENVSGLTVRLLCGIVF